MILCSVIGNIVSTKKILKLVGEKIMILSILDKKLNSFGLPFLAIDRVNCGIGDKVLVLRDGNGVRQIIGREKGLKINIAIKKIIPIKSMIVAIVDEINVN